MQRIGVGKASHNVYTSNSISLKRFWYFTLSLVTLETQTNFSSVSSSAHALASSAPTLGNEKPNTVLHIVKKPQNNKARLEWIGQQKRTAFFPPCVSRLANCAFPRNIQFGPRYIALTALLLAECLYCRPSGALQHFPGTWSRVSSSLNNGLSPSPKDFPSTRVNAQAHEWQATHFFCIRCLLFLLFPFVDIVGAVNRRVIFRY